MGAPTAREFRSLVRCVQLDSQFLFAVRRSPFAVRKSCSRGVSGDCKFNGRLRLGSDPVILMTFSSRAVEDRW